MPPVNLKLLLLSTCQPCLRDKRQMERSAGNLGWKWLQRALMRYQPAPAELFANNRQRLYATLPPRSLVILTANDVLPTNADGSLGFVQNSDLFYLSGIDQEHTILVLFPDAPEPQTPGNPVRARDLRAHRHLGRRKTDEGAGQGTLGHRHRDVDQGFRGPAAHPALPGEVAVPQLQRARPGRPLGADPQRPLHPAHADGVPPAPPGAPLPAAARAAVHQGSRGGEGHRARVLHHRQGHRAPLRLPQARRGRVGG